MYARTTAFSMDLSRRDEATTITHERILPALRALPGFVALHVLMDSASGQGTVLSLWESAAHEEASRELTGRSFAALGSILTGPPEPSRVHEVVVSGSCR